MRKPVQKKPEKNEAKSYPKKSYRALCSVAYRAFAFKLQDLGLGFRFRASLHLRSS